VAVELRDRRDALATALRRDIPELALPHIPTGGYHLWLQLPDGSDEHEVASAALRAGVAVAPGRPYFPAEPPAPHLRLSFAGVAGHGEITEGVRRLRRACDEVLG
jgi:DNA-binding transcriptional MocR family regulator